MLTDTGKFAGRTPIEQAAHERRCAEWERHEARRRAVADQQREANASARMWGEW